MARSRKVEAHVAERRALEAFWEVGYERLSVRDLEERTGINRFLLKTNYGGKTQLFLKLLDQYTDMAREVMFEMVRGGGIEEIALSFEQRVLQDGLPDSSAYGCMVTNTVAEFAETDPAIQIKINAYFEMVRASYKEALHRSRDDGVISADINIGLLSEQLLTQALGLNVRIRAEGMSDGVIASAHETAAFLRKLVIKNKNLN